MSANIMTKSEQDMRQRPLYVTGILTIIEITVGFLMLHFNK